MGCPAEKLGREARGAWRRTHTAEKAGTRDGGGLFHLRDMSPGGPGGSAFQSARMASCTASLSSGIFRRRASIATSTSRW